MSRCILILGVARSGTSAVAGALHHLGVHMLDEDQVNIQATDPNPAGTYEDPEFLEIGMRLQSYGFNLTVDEQRDYLHLIEERQREHALWGFKDPRFMFVLEYFVEALGDCRVVMVSRDPQAVQQSTERWVSELWMPRPWMQVAAFQRAALSFPGLRMTVVYEQLVDNPEREVSRLAAFAFGDLGQRSTAVQVAEAVRFIDPALKHY